MSTTDAARESARQRNGQFGPQRHTELDPADAGLGDSEPGLLPYGSGPRFPMMSWRKAVSVAATAPDLSSVSKRKGQIFFMDGDLVANNLDNQPAVQVFTPHRPTLWRRLMGGRTTYTPESYGSFKHGRLHGWSGTFHPDGSPKEMVWLVASSESSSHPSLKCDINGWPACTGFHRNGRLASVAHMKLGAICDPKPGVPAKRYYGDDGRLLGVEHWSTSSELPYAKWDVDKGWDIEPGWYDDNPRFVEYDPTEAGWLASDRARRP